MPLVDQTVIGISSTALTPIVLRWAMMAKLGKRRDRAADSFRHVGGAAW